MPHIAAMARMVADLTGDVSQPTFRNALHKFAYRGDKATAVGRIGLAQIQL